MCKYLEARDLYSLQRFYIGLFFYSGAGDATYDHCRLCRHSCFCFGILLGLPKNKKRKTNSSKGTTTKKRDSLWLGVGYTEYWRWFFAVLMIAMCDVVQWISSCHAFCIMDYRQCCPSATANWQKNTSRVGVLKLSIKTINCCCKPDLYIRLASEAATSKASNFDNNTKQLVT